jgi:hypothetical protein
LVSVHMKMTPVYSLFSLDRFLYNNRQHAHSIIYTLFFSCTKIIKLWMKKRKRKQKLKSKHLSIQNKWLSHGCTGLTSFSLYLWNHYFYGRWTIERENTFIFIVNFVDLNVPLTRYCCLEWMKKRKRKQKLKSKLNIWRCYFVKTSKPHGQYPTTSKKDIECC